MQFTKLYVLLSTCNMLKREWMDTIVLFVCCVWRTDVSWDNYYCCWCSCSVVNSKVQRNWTMSSSEQFPNYSFSQLVLSVARKDKQVQLKTVVKWTTKLWLYIQYSTYAEKSQIENEQTHFLRFIFIFLLPPAAEAGSRPLSDDYIHGYLPNGYVEARRHANIANILVIV